MSALRPFTYLFLSHMEIIEIDRQDTSELPFLVELLHQQMKDIAAKKSKSEIRNSLLNALKPESRAVIFLAKEENKPLGMAFINVCCGIESGGDYVWINELQISPEFRRQGIAGKILNHVFNWSKARNMKANYAVTDETNLASQSLFKSVGYKIGNIRWMERFLGND